MFLSAIEFNSSLEGWNLRNCVQMVGMFSGAFRFNQNLDSWSINSTSDRQYIFTF